MFVRQQAGVKKPDPSVVPHELKTFDPKSLETAAFHAVMESEGYNLDMILYCFFDTKNKESEKIGVTFGCRDGYGNTVHQMFELDKKKKKAVSKAVIPNHNRWLPPVGIKAEDRYKDPVLSRVATEYAMILAEKKSAGY